MSLQHVRHVELHAGNAGAHEKVQMIERAGAYPQQDFIGFDAGLGSVFVDQRKMPSFDIALRFFRQTIGSTLRPFVAPCGRAPKATA